MMNRLGPFLILCCSAATLALAAAVATSTSAAAPTSSAEPKPSYKVDTRPPTRLLIRSGELVGRDGPIQINSFEADIADGDDGKSPERVGNKTVMVKTGSAFLSNDTLGRLLTGKLKDHHLDEIKVTNDQGKVKIIGKAKKAVTVPFTIEGPLSLTDKGFIRLEMKSVKVAHLPKGVVDLLGLDPEKLAGDGTVKGVSMDKDAISFDPDLLWDMPVHGQVTRLALEKNGLRLFFSSRPTPLRAKNAAPHKK